MAVGFAAAPPRRTATLAARQASPAARRLSFDAQLAAYAGLLAGVGLLMAYSNSVQAGGGVLSPGSTFARGALWAIVAATAFGITSRVDYRWLRTFSLGVYGAAIVILVATLAVGSGASGAARWISVGPVAFQFSELAKVLVIVVLATYLSRHEDRLHSLGVILGAVALVVPPAVLVLRQPDLGTSLVFGAIVVGMLFLSGASLRWLGTFAVALFGAMPLIWEYVLRDYQRARLIAFLEPATDIQGAGYQLFQAQQAIGAGGWIGKGLTNGTPSQADYLPVQTTDFVYALVGEELGVVGGVVVLVLFGLLLWRILLVGWRTPDTFGALFCGGVATMLLFQMIVNIGMVLGVMPITGIPLPFVTHGGASLVSTAFALGVVESIASRAGAPEW